jgi:hypothetical protein
VSNQSCRAKPNMKNEDVFGAVSVALLLLLTAWGNAWALVIASALGLIAGLILFRGSLLRGAGLAATVACVMAAAIEIAIWLRRSR